RRTPRCSRSSHRSRILPSLPEASPYTKPPTAWTPISWSVGWGVKGWGLSNSDNPPHDLSTGPCVDELGDVLLPPGGLELLAFAAGDVGLVFVVSGEGGGARPSPGAPR